MILPRRGPGAVAFSSSKAAWTPPEMVRLTNSRFQIDDTLGSGSAIFTGGNRTAANFDIRAGLIDFDAFLPQGVQIIASGDASGWADIASLVSPIIPDSLALKIVTEKVRLNGVEAENVALDMDSNAAGIAINSLKAAGFGNAQFDASGQVNFGDEGPTGSSTATIRAADPRGLLRLLGLIPQGEEPFWSRPLGATDMKFAVEFKPKKSAPFVDVSVSGKSGELSIEGDVSLAGILDWRNGTIAGSVEVSSLSSSAIAELAGLAPATEGQTPGRLTATVSGVLSDNLSTDVKVEVFGAQLSQTGSFRWNGELAQSEGRAGVNAERSQLFLRSLGLAPDSDGVLAIESDYTLKGKALAFPSIKALWQSESVTGQVDISPEGVLTGELDTGSVDLPSALGAIFLPWDGKPADPETTFAAGWPLGISGELWLRPKRLRLFGNYFVTESQIGIVSNAEGKRVEVRGFAASGEKISVGAGVVPKGALFALDGIVEMPFDLETLVAMPDSRPVASGMGHIQAKFEGKGRSPAAALSALKGSGSYKVGGLKLNRIDTAGFLNLLANAKTAENVRTALITLVSGNSIDLGNVEGLVTIVDGIASFMPVKISSADNDVYLRPLVETATGSADISIQLSIKGARQLPAMEINYSGPPSALVRTVDASALESQLGMEVLQNAMQELEAVQREQQRILEEEARQAKIDADRLAAWEAHRKELQRRLRELKVHQRMREEDAKKYAQWLTDLSKMVKPEMVVRARELRVQRRMRQQQERAEKDAAAAIADPAPSLLWVNLHHRRLNRNNRRRRNRNPKRRPRLPQNCQNHLSFHWSSCRRPSHWYWFHRRNRGQRACSIFSLSGGRNHRASAEANNRSIAFNQPPEDPHANSA